MESHRIDGFQAQFHDTFAVVELVFWGGVGVHFTLPEKAQNSFVFQGCIIQQDSLSQFEAIGCGSRGPGFL